MSDQAIEQEQTYVDGLYARLDDLREEVRTELAAAGRSEGETPQDLLDRDARAARLAQRRDALDHAENGLCFGSLERRDGEVTYIGRIGLRATDLEPILVDWRAPLAADFYTATPASGADLVRRRHIRTQARRVLSVNDELLDLDAPSTSELVGEAALMEALTARRSGRMGEIVATLQAEQDHIIRSGPDGALVVQGGPGTGKTVVALHRTAYLLYTYPQIARRGVLVVGPTPAFLSYISDVLPSLGETQVVLATPQDLYPGVRGQRGEPEFTAHVKGSLEAAALVAGSVRDRQGSAQDVTLHHDGDAYRLPAATIAAAVRRARADGAHHNRGRATFRELILGWLTDQVLAAQARLLAQVEEGFEAELAGVDRSLAAGTDALPGAVEAGGTEVTGTAGTHEITHLRRELLVDPGIADVLEELWPELTASQLLTDLYADPARLERAGSHLGQAELAALYREPGGGWSSADIPLLDEAAELLGTGTEQPDPARRAAETERVRYAEQVLATSGAAGIVNAADLLDRYAADDHRTMAERAAADRSWAYGHVIVDEAQELSPMQWRMIARRVPTGSMTIVGDVNQTFAADGVTSWQNLRPAGRHRASRTVELTVNYRTPQEVMTAALPVLSALDPSAAEPVSVRSAGVEPWQVDHVENLPSRVADLARCELAALQGGNLAVIAPSGALGPIASALAEAVPGSSASPDLDLESICVTLTPQEAKGLEFDGVLVIDAAEILASPRGLNALYVALTRPMRRLGLVHPGPAPDLLSHIRPLGAPSGDVSPAT